MERSSTSVAVLTAASTAAAVARSASKPMRWRRPVRPSVRSAGPMYSASSPGVAAIFVHGRTRAQSLRRLSEVYADDYLASLMQLILQVHAHGGAVQEPLRQFSIRLREQRRNTLKEKVGKLSVKMTVVMMLTLLPALMLVLAGPALVALATTMSKMGSP